MLFYKYECKIANWVDDKNDSLSVISTIKHSIITESALYSSTLNGKAIFLVINILLDNITIGIICNEEFDINKHIKKYLKRINIIPKNGHLTEITLHQTKLLLNKTMLEEAGNDSDSILKQFDINELLLYGSFYFNEEIVDIATKSSIYDKAKRNLTRDTLLPELDRIYQGRTTKCVDSHPVHYWVESDNSSISNDINKTLVQALYSNKRLKSKRLTTLQLTGLHSFPSTYLDRLFKNCEGGTIVVPLVNHDFDSDVLSGNIENILKICECAKLHRYKVLTIFNVNKECTKIKKFILENLDNTTLINIREEFVSDDRAISHLQMLCKMNNIECDDTLIDKLSSNKKYLSSELDYIFDKWYVKKLSTTIYPQYKDIGITKESVIESNTKGSSYVELMNMVGLKEVKKIIDRIINYNRAQKLFESRGMNVEKSSLHMVFTGNPGTAKTSVARLFANIMKENDLISIGNIIEVGRGDLVGKYVGWTAPTIKRKFKEAKGGILFIDEAYSLIDYRENSFGDEAINTIVQEMENHRDDVIVIFAGYPDKMEKFLQKNPGLKSRIAFHVPFEDYSTNELCDIAEYIANQKGVILSSEACDKLTYVFDRARLEEDFGNGRYVRNVIESAKMTQATRLLSMDLDSIQDSDIKTIIADDIEIPTVSKLYYKNAMGFVV